MNSNNYNSPLLLIGEGGSGRSTLLTTIIKHYTDNTSVSSSISNHSLSSYKEKDSVPYQEKAQTNNNNPLQSAGTWHVFYHYVGKHPYSADLRHILQRVWSIPSLPQPRPLLMKGDSNSLAKEVLQLLSTRSEKKTLLIIDSIDKVCYGKYVHALFLYNTSYLRYIIVMA